MSRFVMIQSDALHPPLADASVDMTFCSPPYMDARTYGIDAQRRCSEWIDWMLDVVTELTRVTRGLVLVNCAGVTRKRCYWPGPEGLLYEWWKRGGQCWRPAYWYSTRIPGSGGKHWLRADIEYVLCFKRDAEWPEWSDNTANGHPPKWGPGGEMSNRMASGARVDQWGRLGGPGGFGGRGKDGKYRKAGRPSHRITNQWGHSYATGWTAGTLDDVTCAAPRPSHVAMTAGEVWGGGGSGSRRANGKIKPRYFKASKRRHTKSSADGSDEIQYYAPPVLANPGNLVRINVGGGLLGSRLSHENEAPFPEALASWFIRGWCKPGGIVLDAFSGSGTTVAAARKLGRIGIGIDLRMSQCQLGLRRMREVDRHLRTNEPFLFEPAGEVAA